MLIALYQASLELRIEETYLKPVHNLVLIEEGLKVSGISSYAVKKRRREKKKEKKNSKFRGSINKLVSKVVFHRQGCCFARQIITMNRIFSSNLLPRSIFPSLRASSFLFSTSRGVDKGQQTRNDGCVDRGDTHPYRIHIRTPRSPTLGHRHGLCKWTNVTLDPREQVEYDRRCASGECGVPTTRTWSFRVRRFLSSRRPLAFSSLLARIGGGKERGGKKKVAQMDRPSARGQFASGQFVLLRIVCSVTPFSYWIFGF